MDDPRFIQKGFGLKRDVAADVANDWRGDLVDRLRERGNSLYEKDLELHIAAEFGFCYGVDRAIDYAYETRRHFPDRTLYLTNEMIHNPAVNDRLRSMGFRFFEDGYSPTDVGPDDVVLLPAFGATVEVIDAIKARGAVIVDTTCGSVMNVWKRVEAYGREGFTSLVHGKYAHEETIATCSRALAEKGHYLVVRDLDETQLVIDFMLRAPDAQLKSREAFLQRFSKAVSPGFDPELHLQRLGIANQTTMLASESSEVSRLFEQAIIARDGAEKAQENFRRFDTICSATQDRQDAIITLGESTPLDLILVVGGYNSSNTAHLAKIASKFAPAFHVDSASALRSADEIEHMLPGKKSTSITQDWLPERRPLRLGVTSGASTPNSIVSEVVLRAASFLNLDLNACLGLQAVPQLDIANIDV